MIFNTWTYGLFLTVFVLIYWFCVPVRYRPQALLTAGLIFYTYYYPFHTILIVLLSLAVFGIGRQIDRSGEPRRRQFWLVTGITVCLAVLAYYKYLKLMISTLNQFFHLASMPFGYEVPVILVPLGLSFFIFEFIHFLVDVYRGTAKQTSLLNFGVFALFFPTLVAGPIKRYQNFLGQLENLPAFSLEFWMTGLGRILVGIAKKMIIADSMNQFIVAFQNPGQATAAELWVAILAYSVKIYFDFSGYSDIAIGSARLLGFKILENFNAPYLKPNISEFWRNWHISLSSWIRDYLYIPLGGNRGTLAFAMRNTMISMALCGLWHGAAWNFVVWGIYHGFGLAVYRLYRNWRKQRPLPLDEMSGIQRWAINAAGVLGTFVFVSVGWVFFVNNIRDSLTIIGKIFGLW